MIYNQKGRRILRTTRIGISQIRRTFLKRILIIGIIHYNFEESIFGSPHLWKLPLGMLKRDPERDHEFHNLQYDAGTPNSSSKRCIERGLRMGGA